MKKTTIAIGLIVGIAANAFAQENQCIKDYKNARLIADFQTASLLCPKWKIVNRVNYGYLLLQLKVIKSNDLQKSKNRGVLTLTEQCQDELYDIEKDSFKDAEKRGLEAFCIRTSGWLTVPNLRHALEQNGFFPTDIK